jgi:predicted lipid-binding transport protein (Tim44 family)
MWGRRIGMLAAVGVIVVASVASLDAEAARMGGGRSFGRQSSIASQRSATPPPAQPAPSQQPAQAPRAQPNGAPGNAPGAAPARSRWLGPIAGLAAGLGIAALLSHFGLGEAFAGAMANVIVVALIAALAIWLIRKFTSRRRPVEPSYMTGGGAGLPSGGLRTGDMQPRYTAPPTGPSLAPEAGPLTTPPVGGVPSVPANFDTETFLRNAKVYFVRLQAAWDAGNVDDIRQFTTPEMFAEVRVDLAGRGSQSNQTDVVQLNADLLGVEERDNEYFASVRFHGLIRESAGVAAEPFVEVWNLSKSRLTGEGWLLAGIQQVESH